MVVFLGVSMLLLAASATLTVTWCTSMAAMGGMPMPGGWTMSMAWMPTAGQTWLDAATSFLGMWTVMMVAMMLPSLAPTLSRSHRRPLPAALGYFAVWTAFGAAVFPIGVAATTVEMQQAGLARVVPIAVGIIVSIAGAVQFSAWKARQLACCRQDGGGCSERATAVMACRDGVRVGLRCVKCCGNLMAVLLVLGVMDLRVMTLVTAAITAERLAPAGHRVTRMIGVVIAGAGVVLTARESWPG